MNSPKLKSIIKKVVANLQAMSKEEIIQLEKSLPEGPFFNALLESGFIQANEMYSRMADPMPKRVFVTPIIQVKQPELTMPLLYSSSQMVKTGFVREYTPFHEDIEWAA